MENDIEGLKAFELLKKNIEIENKNNSNEIMDEGINLNNIQSLSQIKNMPPTNNLLINARKYVVKCRIINMKKKLILEEEKQIEKQIKEEEEEQKEKQQMQNKIKLILNSENINDNNNNNNNNNNNIFKTDIKINNNNNNTNKIKINRRKKSLITINPKQQAYDDFVNGCLNRLEEEKKLNYKYNKENNEMIRKYMNDNRNYIIKKIMKYKNDVPYENILNEIVYDLHNLCEQFVPKNFINDKKIKKNRNKILLPPIHNQKQNFTMNFDVQSKISNDNKNNISKNNLFNNDNINHCINNNKSNYVKININKSNNINNNNNNYNENDFKLNSDIVPKKSKKILFISLNKKNIKNKNINNNYINNSINDTTNSKSVNTNPIENINSN